MIRNENLKKKIISRINRVAGQVGGIKGMLESNRDYLDVITQISAIRAAMSQVEIMMIEDHLEGSIRTAIKTGKREELDSSLNKIMKQMLK